MTPLARRLVTQAEREGPMTVADFMTACLLHPTLGYYTNRDPLGAAGDFITAPEISQMFGELIGLWLAQCWMDQGAPDRIVLAELGPGRGTLMADLLRATQAVPGFHDALDLHLVEASPVLRSVQTRALKGNVPSFHAGIEEVPDAPLYLVANEFFDALPIRQFQRAGKAWRERLLGMQDGGLAWGLGPETNFSVLNDRVAGTSDGQIVEHRPAADAIAADIGRRIAAHGGAAIIVDYGETDSIGDTLQAVQAHETVDPLVAPGKADLTAHVAFNPIARAAKPARASALVPQGVFLERLGITRRAQSLATGMTGATLETHVAAHRRLTHPDAMGHLFKTLALTPPGAPPPPAMEPLPPS